MRAVRTATRLNGKCQFYYLCDGFLGGRRFANEAADSCRLACGGSFDVARRNALFEYRRMRRNLQGLRFRVYQFYCAVPFIVR